MLPVLQYHLDKFQYISSPIHAVSSTSRHQLDSRPRNILVVGGKVQGWVDEWMGQREREGGKAGKS